MTHPMSPAGIDRLHQAMAARVAKGELPGMVILVAQGDEVHVDTIGGTAFGNDDPMQRGTIFRIASMTKPILATATMMLVEDGRLALAEPVDRLLPELADRRVLKRIDGPLDDTVPANRPIAVEDLLTFRLGYGLLFEPSFEPPYPIVNAAKELQLVMGPPDPRTPHSPGEWIKRFGALPLMYQPGERWQYNVGSLVLSVLVARASGQPLEDFFRSRIFEPLGMKETSFSMPQAHAGGLPSYYMTNFQTGKMELQTLSAPGEWTRPPAFPSGASGLLSTADDYLAFSRLLLNLGGSQGRAALVGEIGRADDDQPPDAGTDGRRRAGARRAWLGFRHGRRLRTGRGVARSRPLRLGRRLRNIAVQRPQPQPGRNRPDTNLRLPVQRRLGRVREAGGWFISQPSRWWRIPA
jgi:CubicO group peptidase (beta-lactamase class C family)